jgi:hypothetical protein
VLDPTSKIPEYKVCAVQLELASVGQRPTDTRDVQLTTDGSD